MTLGAQSAWAADPTLYVKYTMTCTFGITGDNGATISVIPPGRYQVLVTTPVGFAEPDLSGISDPNYACGGSPSWRMTGPGVNLHTTMEGGDASAEQFQATFQAGGSYVALEEHAPGARVSFTVSSTAASTGGTSTGSSTGSGSTGSTGTGSTATGAKVLATLSGSVDTKGKLTLKRSGKAVSSLKAGRYTISVLDNLEHRVRAQARHADDRRHERAVRRQALGDRHAQGRAVVVQLEDREEDLLPRTG